MSRLSAALALLAWLVAPGLASAQIPGETAAGTPVETGPGGAPGGTPEDASLDGPGEEGDSDEAAPGLDTPARVQEPDEAGDEDSAPPGGTAAEEDEFEGLGDDDEFEGLGDDDELEGLGDDDEFEGMGDDSETGGDAYEPPPQWSFALTGFLRTDWALWVERFEDNPFAKARQSGDLRGSFSWRWLRLILHMHAEYDFAYLVERDSYDQPTLDAYEWQVATREALAQISLGDFEITVGRQIVAWGEGDMLSALDVVNPRDMREPGQSDLDDVRLATLATRVGWFQGDHRLELMLIHESDWGYRSPPAGPFSGFKALITKDEVLAGALAGKTLSFHHLQPRFALDQQEVLLRWVYKGAGVDVGAYFASVHDRQGAPVLDLQTLDQAQQLLAGDEVRLDLDHRRYHLLGTSGAWPHGPFLVKWELSLDVGRPIAVTGVSPLGDALPSFSVETRQVINSMLGVTWTGVQDLTIGFEVLKPYVISKPNGMLYDANAPTFALRASYLTLRERLTFSAAALFMGWYREQGWLVRADVEYAIMDGLAVRAGYVTYQPGSAAFGPFLGLDRHDRVFAQLRWDFQIL